MGLLVPQGSVWGCVTLSDKPRALVGETTRLVWVFPSTSTPQSFSSLMGTFWNYLVKICSWNFFVNLILILRWWSLEISHKCPFWKLATCIKIPKKYKCLRPLTQYFHFKEFTQEIIWCEHRHMDKNGHQVFFLFLSLFVWERQRQHEWGRGRERRRERIPSRLYAVSAEPDVGLEPTKSWDRDLSRNQELDAQPTESPGDAPSKF